MGDLISRRRLSDRLVAQLRAEQDAHPVAGDFAAVCTDLARDTWELFPIALTMSDGTVLQLRDEHGALLSFSSVSERDHAVTTPAGRFPDLEAVRALCWTAFDGLGALRVRLARLRSQA